MVLLNLSSLRIILEYSHFIKLSPGILYVLVVCYRIEFEGLLSDIVAGRRDHFISSSTLLDGIVITF